MCRKKSARLVYRGGNWNNTSNAGVFYANGNNPRSNYNTNIGFRPALVSTVKNSTLKGKRNERSKGHISRRIAPKIKTPHLPKDGANCAGYTNRKGKT